MTLTHLIPLSHFVNKIDEIVPPEGNVFWQQNQLSTIKRYTAFLLRPLELFMFVPVSESGEVLYGKPLSPATDEEWDKWQKDQENGFFKAKEKCLFEGFETGLDEYNDVYVTNGFHSYYRDCFEQIEDLVNDNLPLTAQAIKQISG